MSGAPRDRVNVINSVMVPVQRLKRRPSATAYCLLFEGAAMAPDIGDGDTVAIDPALDPAAGDIVIIWPEDRARRPSIWHLLAVSDRHATIILGTSATKTVIQKPLAEISAMHVVIGACAAHEVIRTPVGSRRLMPAS